MKISLRTLLILSGVASVVVGAFCNQYLNSLRVESRVNEFTYLGRASERLEPMLRSELSKLPEVKQAFVEFQKRVPSGKVDDILLGGFSGGFASSQSNVLFSKWAMGQIRVEYTFSLMKTFGEKPDPWVALEVRSEMDAQGDGPHLLTFRFPDSKLNRLLAEKVVDELAEESDFIPKYEPYQVAD